MLFSHSGNLTFDIDQESIEINDLSDYQDEFLPIHFEHTPLEKNEENREKEENNQEDDSKNDSFAIIGFCNNTLDSFSYDIQINTKLHHLACACANRLKISKFILFHNWKIDCAL